jgi:hypothetical protein
MGTGDWVQTTTRDGSAPFLLPGQFSRRAFCHPRAALGHLLHHCRWLPSVRLLGGRYKPARGRLHVIVCIKIQCIVKGLMFHYLFEKVHTFHFI